jgi:hypothetical protein
MSIRERSAGENKD